MGSGTPSIHSRIERMVVSLAFWFYQRSAVGGQRSAVDSQPRRSGPPASRCLPPKVAARLAMKPPSSRATNIHSAE